MYKKVIDICIINHNNTAWQYSAQGKMKYK